MVRSGHMRGLWIYGDATGKEKSELAYWATRAYLDLCSSKFKGMKPCTVKLQITNGLVRSMKVKKHLL